jgi:toxin-antitoxin system PIN domain toxin
VVLPDVNVLIYAFREDVPHHNICRSWLEAAIGADSRFGLSPLGLSALVRITTNPRIFAQPSGIDEALGFCQDLLEQPNCQIVQPGERHWNIFRCLCIETGTHGPRVTDAWFAALAIEWDCEWVTFDRDYRRFPGLRLHRPE